MPSGLVRLPAIVPKIWFHESIPYGGNLLALCDILKSRCAEGQEEQRMLSDNLFFDSALRHNSYSIVSFRFDPGDLVTSPLTDFWGRMSCGPRF